MKEHIFEPNQVINYWMVEADESLTVATHLFEKKDYSYALFFGHLAIEKMLKAVYVARKKEHAPPIHNLKRLGRLAGITLDNDKSELLILISSFNIEARYPDLKRSFRKKCTEAFTLTQMNNIKEIYKWLKEMIK
ncbi:MAG: HEPN domain-containing protein [Deltaproteobacteria bacterium]|nr:HEPN domain-containing protein [Deltaproteobacteria bacterium]MBW1941083.1 HEPN domain-containing protein [Deltaproteobacteria bacterium]MBW2011327.1 HEPN domain-containing protein [Deltaproteobacteria bacterium]MBW2101004.1 HEPN domain-containing protein [Deltaproteobacteria bacterium]